MQLAIELKPLGFIWIIKCLLYQFGPIIKEMDGVNYILKIGELMVYKLYLNKAIFKKEREKKKKLMELK